MCYMALDRHGAAVRTPYLQFELLQENGSRTPENPVAAEGAGKGRQNEEATGSWT